MLGEPLVQEVHSLPASPRANMWGQFRPFTEKSPAWQQPLNVPVGSVFDQPQQRPPEVTGRLSFSAIEDSLEGGIAHVGIPQP
jgi:hypothetical protein